MEQKEEIIEIEEKEITINDERLNLIKSVEGAIAEKQEIYKKPSRKKKKKFELAKEYLDLCISKGVESKYTDAQLKKVTNKELITEIESMEVENYVKPDPEIEKILDNKSEEKKIVKKTKPDKRKRVSTGEYLYKLNGILIGLIEFGSKKVDKNKKVVDLTGAYSQFLRPEIKEKMIDTYSEAYDEYPDFCDILTNWKLRAGIDNYNFLTAQNSINKLENKKKEKPE
jgi:hypothetical protein